MKASLHCSEHLADEKEETCPTCVLFFNPNKSPSSLGSVNEFQDIQSSYLPNPSYALTVQNCQTFCRYREHTYMWMLGVVEASSC